MKLEGDVAEIDLIERLVDLWREKFTGALRFENDGIIKIIYFKTGDVISASTNDRADSVDEILMRAGKVNREHVKQALAKRKDNETLGDALLNLGFITRKELTWARRVQVIGVIRSISLWTAGSFTIVNDYLPKREEGTLFSFPQILLELIVTDQDRVKFDRALEGGEIVFRKTPDFDTTFVSLGLNEDAEQVVREVDGQRSAAEVATASGKDTFNVYKLLHALARLQLVSRSGAAQPISFTMDDVAAPDLDLDEDTLSGKIGNLGSSTPAFQTEPEPPPSVAANSVDASDAFAPAGFDSVDEEDLPLADQKTQAWSVPQPAPEVYPSASDPAPKTTSETLDEWGLDEGQLEAVKKVVRLPTAAKAGTLAGTKKTVSRGVPKRKSRSRSAIIAIVAILILAGGGYAGYLWWQSRSAPEVAAAQPVRPAPRPRPVPPPVATTSTLEPTTTAPSATAATPPTTTSVQATPATTTRIPATSTVPPPAVASAAKPPVAVPAPMPVTPRASNDPARERYDAMARDYLQTAPGNYTVQFELVCQPGSITKALEQGGKSVWFVSLSYRGESCYRVFWGHYDTQAAASAAVSTIPKALRGAAPVVVRVPRS